MNTEQIETQLAQLGKQLAAIRQRENELKNSLRDLAGLAYGAGVTEVRIAELAAVDRMTVRRWLGKL